MSRKSKGFHTSENVSYLVRGWLKESCSEGSGSQSVSLPPTPSLATTIYRPERLGLGAEKKYGAIKKKEEEQSILFRKIKKRIVGSSKSGELSGKCVTEERRKLPVKTSTVNSSENGNRKKYRNVTQDENESEDESCSKIGIVSSSKTRKSKLELLKKQKLKSKKKRKRALATQTISSSSVVEKE